MASGIEVRSATPADVARMAELDRQAFAGLGMGYYGESYVRCWMEVNPEGLLIAWQGATAVACCYSQYVDFSPAAVGHLATDSEFTDSAYTRRTHRPDGNSIQVVTVSSIAPGGRRALFEALRLQLVAQRRAYLLLFSRLAGFDEYCRKLTERGTDVGSLSQPQLASWYVQQCASRFVGPGRVWAEVGGGEESGLPPPTAPDPVLNKYLKDPGAAVAAVLEGWIEDPASRNCSALVVSANPSRH